MPTFEAFTGPVANALIVDGDVDEIGCGKSACATKTLITIPKPISGGGTH